MKKAAQCGLGVVLLMVAGGISGLSGAVVAPRCWHCRLTSHFGYTLVPITTGHSPSSSQTMDSNHETLMQSRALTARPVWLDDDPGHPAQVVWWL